jgi:hypothetical protein
MTTVRPLRLPRRAVVRLQDRRSDAGLKFAAARRILLSIDPSRLTDDERAALSFAMAECARWFDPHGCPALGEVTRH